MAKHNIQAQSNRVKSGLRQTTSSIRPCSMIYAIIAPTLRSRRVLLTAAVIEFAVSAHAFVCLVVLHHWLV
jgi:hypothetical protein